MSGIKQDDETQKRLSSARRKLYKMAREALSDKVENIEKDPASFIAHLITGAADQLVLDELGLERDFRGSLKPKGYIPDKDKSEIVAQMRKQIREGATLFVQNIKDKPFENGNMPLLKKYEGIYEKAYRAHYAELLEDELQKIAWAQAEADVKLVVSGLVEEE